MKHPFKRKHIGEILVEKKWVKTSQLQEGLQQTDILIGQWLLQRHCITEEQLAQALAEQFQLSYVDLKGHTVPLEMFENLSASKAYHYSVLPYSRENGTLKVVISNPLESHQLADQLEQASGLRVEFLLASKASIMEALERSQATSALLKDVSGGFKTQTKDAAKASVSAATLDDNESGIVKLINTILLSALQKRASDIHFEAYETGTIIKYRIDGLLYQATEKLDYRFNKSFVSRIKVMAELDIAETRVPQYGRFQLRLNGKDIDFRVSVMPSALGEDVVIRILDKSSLHEEFSQLRLDILGLASETLKKFRRSIREPYGMVLITGPTGSGKTTTLYAALSEINTGEEKIVTIEDPVEYQLAGIVQVPVNEKKGLTFARGLRSILRHDPDKIMVGEIRDTETAQIAVQSALTGHLVFTTVHANNACDVMGRFSHMGVNLYSFVSALNCVMAQRLVRVICPKCKRKDKVDKELLTASGLTNAKYKNDAFYSGKGCDYCGGTGYRGRRAVAEFLNLTPKIRKMIIDQVSVDELQQTAVAEGMVTLRSSALAAALAGITTLKEINRVTFVD